MITEQMNKRFQDVHDLSPNTLRLAQTLYMLGARIFLDAIVKGEGNAYMEARIQQIKEKCPEAIHPLVEDMPRFGLIDAMGLLEEAKDYDEAWLTMVEETVAFGEQMKDQIYERNDAAPPFDEGEDHP